MTNEAALEKVRQAIMRHRELLDLAHLALEQGERDYTALFAVLPDDQRQTLPEKDQQTEAARLALTDLTQLRKTIFKVQMDMREMERAFEELCSKITPEEMAAVD